MLNLAHNFIHNFTQSHNTVALEAASHSDTGYMYVECFDAVDEK